MPDGSGRTALPLSVEGFHQLHCLNMLRLALFTNHEFYADVKAFRPGQPVQEHLDHCVDMIRERLMCTMDTTLEPWLWRGRKGDAVADSQRVHVCRDFEGIRRWVAEREWDGIGVGGVKPVPGEGVEVFDMYP